MDITPTQLADLLSRTISRGLPVLTRGSPGVGKSDIHAQAAEAAGYAYKVLYPSLMDPTDMGGLPVPTGTGTARRVERLLDDALDEIVRADKPTLVLLDELGQASPAMQSACAPLLLARTLAGRRIPDHVTVCAATNRRQDKAGASHLLTHLLSRMTTIVDLVPDVESWAHWGATHGIRPEIVSFLRFRPSLLAAEDDDLQRAYEGGTAYPSPRSWAHVSSLLDAELPSDLEPAAYAGAVGQGASVELLAHLSMCRADIDMDAILAGGKFPAKKPAAMYAIACCAAHRASVPGPSLRLAERMHAGGLSEYAVLLVRDALARHAAVAASPEWLRLSKGPLGEAIRHA